MKTKITYTFFIGLCVLLGLNYNQATASSSGSPGGRSSSIGDGGGSCGQGGCHGGGHTVQSGIITTNIPAAGYTPGMTYTVDVGGTSGTGTKFGFELAAENSTGTTAGTLATTGPRQQVLSNGQGTHTGSGNTGMAGTFGWSFDWTAPASGFGAVTFSTAVLVANNNFANTGDNTIKFDLIVQEMVNSTSLEEISSANTSLYPNPVIDHLNIYSENPTVNHVSVLNMEGKLVFHSSISSVDRIDLSFLDKGMYFVTVKNNTSQFTKKMIKL